ncbi:adenosylcobinamide amidohydrolase [Couchioplanes azureus]|uniref:adenosylcobinamide amidohydrolase n=1 Tax=Couchioplanes caeruleus TaxID=56438 RepID=UPI00166FAD12|nr:adenosylcobinamide amidohydrolase [Couchioplanes caeruleus]GGQ56379.1 adenosylcobinamide amidohydrolase [Couchioplanes caeruleus subsp. azureus]
MIGEPLLTHRDEGGCDVPLLVWRLSEPALAISSAVLGGGIGPCRWLVNATVPMSYDRDDPAVHLAGIAAGLGLAGPGVGLLTGVDVADVVTADEEGVRLWATVGLGAPVQAAAPAAEAAPHAGTVNIVAWVPRRLSDGALVNAVATLTEAKTQAIRELGLAATGTATDAVAVLCPPAGPEAEYAGPRSQWGRRLARAGHRAVLSGGAVNLAGTASWSERRAGTHTDP